jgi:hypothetical protein
MKKESDEITFEMLKEIHNNLGYNPLGEKQTYLVDDFLVWSRQEGDFYWIWGGAIELADGREDPKYIIKDLPLYASKPSTYQDLLIDAWLKFLTNDEKTKENLGREHDMAKLALSL